MPYEYYDDIVKDAIEKNDLVQKTAKHILFRTQNMKAVQHKMAFQLRLAHENGVYEELSGVALQKKVVGYVEDEIKYFSAFNAEKRTEKPALPFQVDYHRMHVILPAVAASFASEEDGSRAFHDVTQGQFKPDESFDVNWPALRTNSYWGSNKGVIESAKLMCVRFATSSDTIKDYMTTAIGHVTPCPNLPVSFQSSGSKFYTPIDVKGTLQPGFGFVHGGYAFGGQRDEFHQYEFGPEDCSSMLHNVMESSVSKKFYSAAASSQFSTPDMLFAWRRHQKAGTFHIDKAPWSQYVYDNTQAVSVESLQPGDLFLMRKSAQSDGNPDTHAKGGGHTGVVIGDDPQNRANVLILECARDMERENPKENIWGCAGAGVGSFPKAYEQTQEGNITRTMFLRLKK